MRRKYDYKIRRTDVGKYPADVILIRFGIIRFSLPRSRNADFRGKLHHRRHLNNSPTRNIIASVGLSNALFNIEVMRARKSKLVVAFLHTKIAGARRSSISKEEKRRRAEGKRRKE